MAHRRPKDNVGELVEINCCKQIEYLISGIIYEKDLW